MKKPKIFFILILILLVPSLTGCENLSAAVAYANQYWNSYNPAYGNFGGNNVGYNNVGGDGVDCTNFISQAMYAGGES